MEATDHRLTEKQRRTLVSGATAQARQGAYALHGKQYRELEIKGLARSKVEGARRLYEITPAGVELADTLRRRRGALDDPRGRPQRTGKAVATRMWRTRCTNSEDAEFAAFIEAQGGSMSEWIREGLYRVGALKRP
jgi:hypothetical protein